MVCYTGETTYSHMSSILFIALRFQNGGRFVGILSSYGQTPWPILMKIAILRYIYKASKSDLLSELVSTVQRTTSYHPRTS